MEKIILHYAIPYIYFFPPYEGYEGMSMSLRDAINGKCRDCIYDPLSGLGNWRQQVEACTAKACPLWPVRPVSKPDYRTRTDKTDSEAASDPEKACFGGLDGRGATGVATP